VCDVIDVSSEYIVKPGWSADQIIGPPRVYPRYGDFVGTWAPKGNNTVEFITLKFPEPIAIQEIHVYETNCPGGITRISAIKMSKETIPMKPAPLNFTNVEWIDLYTGPQTLNLSISRIFNPTLMRKDVYSNIIRLDIDGRNMPSCCEIDAVKLTGRSDRVEEPSQLSYDIAKLLKNLLFSDVIFEVEGQEIKAHRNILVARSDFFRAMFTTGMKEAGAAKVPVPNVSYPVFMNLLEFLYTDSVEIPAEHVVPLYCAADQYNLPKLKQLCTADFELCVDIDNIVPLYIHVTELHAKDLENICLKFIIDNYKEVTKSSNFTKLTHSLLITIIRAYVDK